MCAQKHTLPTIPVNGSSHPLWGETPDTKGYVSRLRVLLSVYSPFAFSCLAYFCCSSLCIICLHLDIYTAANAPSLLPALNVRRTFCSRLAQFLTRPATRLRKKPSFIASKMSRSCRNEPKFEDADNKSTYVKHSPSRGRRGRTYSSWINRRANNKESESKSTSPKLCVESFVSQGCLSSFSERFRSFACNDGNETRRL